MTRLGASVLGSIFKLFIQISGFSTRVVVGTSVNNDSVRCPRSGFDYFIVYSK